MVTSLPISHGSIDESDKNIRSATPRSKIAEAEGAARVWDAQTGQPMCEPMKHDASIESARFSPDGSVS